MSKRKIIIVVASVGMLGLAFLLWIAINLSPGTHGKIAFYESNLSKNEVNQAMKQFFANYPQYKIPPEWASYAVPYRTSSSDSQNKTDPMNADSVNFHFYIEKEGVIVWTAFYNIQYEWIEKQCQLGLIGFISPSTDHKWHFKDDLTKDQQQVMMKLFENEVIEKLKPIKFKVIVD